MILLALRKLYPLYIIITNGVSFLVWAVLLVCTFTTWPYHTGIFQLVAEAVLIITGAGQLMYSIVLYKRVRRSSGRSAKREVPECRKSSSFAHPAGLSDEHFVLDDNESDSEKPLPDYLEVVGHDIMKVSDAR